MMSVGSVGSVSVGISIFSQSHSHFRLKPVIISGSSTVQQLLERSELREGETRPGPQSPEWVSRGISMGVFYGIFEPCGASAHHSAGGPH
jgi:hypothetical protein